MLKTTYYLLRDTTVDFDFLRSNMGYTSRWQVVTCWIKGEPY